MKIETKLLAPFERKYGDLTGHSSHWQYGGLFAVVGASLRQCPKLYRFNIQLKSDPKEHSFAFLCD